MSEQIKAQASFLIPQIEDIRVRALELEQTYESELAALPAGQRNSARNLLHYLALRQTDVRQLQQDLTALGLSSLGRAESSVLSTLNAVGIALYRLAQRPVPPKLLDETPANTDTGPMLLNNHSDTLLGIASGKRTVRIMVTMPSEAASQPALVHDLLEAGMDVMRINCAHDGPEAWQLMIDNLRQAERKLGRICKVYVDLAGPKLRTGAIPPLTRMRKVRPQRNGLGQVQQPARVQFLASLQPAAEATVLPCVPVSDELLEYVQIGDVFELKDARDKQRRFKIIEKNETGCLGESNQTTYFESGETIALRRGDEILATGIVGLLPEFVEPLLLNPGDTLLVTKEDQQATYAALHISCTLPEIFESVKVGEAIWFDDGKIGGRIVAVEPDQISVEITPTGSGTAKLAAEKGINLPDSIIKVPALTSKDLEDLAYMASRADIIGLSFVRTPQDVQQLASELIRLGATHVGMVLKIETRLAFDDLPRLLLASMHSPSVGVMVARGDLAVELGFERLAEVQEEILWFCEAAHVPVIWATQVLESMAKSGAPSRAEVSDAVMSGRAECVMLNKGPFIVGTVRFLNSVLERMAAHQTKKRSMLRRLSVSKLD